MAWSTATGWNKPAGWTAPSLALGPLSFRFKCARTLSQLLFSLGCARSISADCDVFAPVNLELVRAKFDSQSAASGSNPKSQRKPQLKQPIFAQFLANATCFFKEGGGFPQISTRILSKVCKSLPNPSQTWAQIQKYSENRFFFPGTFAAGSGQDKKE